MPFRRGTCFPVRTRRGAGFCPVRTREKNGRRGASWECPCLGPRRKKSDSGMSADWSWEPEREEEERRAEVVAALWSLGYLEGLGGPPARPEDDAVWGWWRG